MGGNDEDKNSFHKIFFDHILAMLSRNIVSRPSTLLRRAIRAKSTQVRVEESINVIGDDGRHEVSFDGNYDNETK